MVLGEDTYGQLGVGIGGNSSTAVQVTYDGVTPFILGTTGIAISAGYEHSLALMDDGTVWAWGRDDSGQQGNGTNGSNDYPTQVKYSGGADFFAIDIAAGRLHNLAITPDHKVWAWGEGTDGGLGTGTDTDDSLYPLAVQLGGNAFPLTDSATAIAAGWNFSLAIIDDGDNKTLWSWGSNYFGQLGDGTDYTDGGHDKLNPVVVKNTNDSPFITNSNIIAAGYRHSLAIKDDDSLWSWGEGQFGQLGDGENGTLYHQNHPAMVLDYAGAIDVTAGGFHSISTKQNTLLMAAGWVDYGQVGAVNLENDIIVPTSVRINSGVPDFANTSIFDADMHIILQ